MCSSSEIIQASMIENKFTIHGSAIERNNASPEIIHAGTIPNSNFPVLTPDWDNLAPISDLRV